MSHRALIFVAKSDSATFQEFKEKYEKYVKTVCEVAGDAAPVRHTRRYIQHGEDNKPLVLAGNASEINFDCIVEVEFADANGFMAFATATSSEEAQAKIKVNDGDFMDNSKMKLVVVEEVDVWTKP
jgi:hypothetical protein